VIVAEFANNDSVGIANHKSQCRAGLPLLDTMVSGDSHGQVNEFDTYKVAQLGPNVLSRILQHLSGKFNVVVSSPYYDDCQKPCTYFKIEDIRAQSPKTITPNAYTPQLRDLTAYEYNQYLMRGRNFHSSTERRKRILVTLKEWTLQMNKFERVRTDFKFGRANQAQLTKAETIIDAYINTHEVVSKETKAKNTSSLIGEPLKEKQDLNDSSNTKGSSRKSPTTVKHDFNAKDSGSLNLPVGSEPPMSVNS